MKFTLTKMSTPGFVTKTNYNSVVEYILKHHICDECLNEDFKYYNELLYQKNTLQEKLRVSIDKNEEDLSNLNGVLQRLVNYYLLSSCGAEFSLNDITENEARIEWKTFNCNDCAYQAVLLPDLSNKKLQSELFKHRCLNTCTMNLSQGIVEIGAFNSVGRDMFIRQEKALGVNKEKVRSQLDLRNKMIQLNQLK